MGTPSGRCRRARAVRAVDRSVRRSNAACSRARTAARRSRSMRVSAMTRSMTVVRGSRRLRADFAPSSRARSAARGDRSTVYGRPPVSVPLVTDPLIAPALPGLGPEPPRPFARATEPAEALREVFGFAGIRPGQREAVDAAVAGRDVLVVMPTGSGKSLCYQLPALMRADLTLVVSPLVSLMQDQVEALERVAPGKVALVNAQQDAAGNRAAVDRAVSG